MEALTHPQLSPVNWETGKRHTHFPRLRFKNKNQFFSFGWCLPPFPSSDLPSPGTEVPSPVAHPSAELVALFILKPLFRERVGIFAGPAPFHLLTNPFVPRKHWLGTWRGWKGWGERGSPVIGRELQPLSGKSGRKVFANVKLQPENERHGVGGSS